ncbi:hypothetical protein A3715_09305 [Oleiphilus sp. HI0009]|uniref:DNA repair protein RecO n=1 Tax=unclassified Oleiphilus TaxID=2631174 RepID=UPI0007C3F00D|nr:MULTISPECIES: DNA repair protein RecO [unclassified Oleiphilus]KZX79009.1 hypothetical protein A3715_09305 [Oleiphilus sp. HI0009]KZY62050.1 hypothetical protein A3738_13160 [Oleiphilus sp. HI0066]KZY68775.1 hypothetical protein A3739_20030 [Oleiphilus sp. HI0067]KZY69671.1 hypothetical protein A3739_08460 [Oleiphilus sp. HI0067]
MFEASYILHRRPFSDTSLLLDVFTYQHGKVGLVAKGGYKAKSSKSAILQAFQPLLIDWVGKSDLKTLTQAEPPSAQLELTGQRQFAGLYINELLYKLLAPEEPMPALFSAYVECLSGLSEGEDMSQMLRDFELILLAELGLLPSFDIDWQGKVIQSESNYYLSADSTFVLTQENSRSYVVFSGQDLLAYSSRVQALVSNKSANQVNDLKAVYQTLNKKVSYMLIDQALQGAKLRSRELIKQFSKYTTVG